MVEFIKLILSNNDTTCEYSTTGTLINESIVGKYKTYTDVNDWIWKLNSK